MFKKLFAILLALLIFCSCGAEEPSEPVIPEEPQVSETEPEIPEKEPDLHELRKSLEYPGLSITPCDFEGGYPYTAEDISVPEGAEELLYRIGRTGEFHGVRHIPQEYIIFSALLNLDMVEAYGNEELAPIAEEVGNTCFYPREWVMEAAREIYGDIVFHHQDSAEGLFTYHEKAGVYTPPNMGLNTVIPYIVSCSGNGSNSYTVEFFYMEASMSGYQLGDGDIFVPCSAELNENLFEKPEFIEFVESGKDLYTAFLRIENGKFRINHVYKKHYEPELIAEHIAALNMCVQEYFGAECKEDSYCSFYFKEENTDWNTLPDFISYDIDNDPTEGLYYDYFERTVREVSNFRTKDEVREYMGQWLSSLLLEPDHSGIDYNFMEAEGKLYLLRGNRGYGIESYGNSKIVSETETEMTASAYIYHNEISEVGTAEIKFEKIDGRWIIVSVENNYY